MWLFRAGDKTGHAMHALAGRRARRRDRRHAGGTNCGVALSPPFRQFGYDGQLTMDETVTVCVLVFPGNAKSSSFPGFGRERGLRSFHRINPPQLGKSGYLQRSDPPLRLGRISSSWRTMQPPARTNRPKCRRCFTPPRAMADGLTSFRQHAPSARVHPAEQAGSDGVPIGAPVQVAASHPAAVKALDRTDAYLAVDFPGL